MKRISLITILILLLPSFAFAETMRVITKENYLRDGCRFFAPVKTNLKYGDPLEIISQEGDWYKARFKGVSGCIHKTAVDQKTVQPTTGFASGRQTATEQEVALAGKGFTPEVESAFRRKHPEMRFNLVDAIERYKTDEKRVADFIRMGGLVQP
ncbi:MAG: hypothetical protein N3A62_09025 [Thermodesulfovibrionales bacterium]|nr:hypothetical protein [Thermodesulfovibrionales bacterium]